VAVERNTERRALVSFMRQALWAQPALLVRGSSRRITSMRFRPANTRVINRRDDRLDRHLRCFPLVGGKRCCKIKPLRLGWPYQKISFSANWISLFEVDVASIAPAPPVADPS
jgi:hypothetical protein